jgi:hypothetical protein
MVKLQEAENQIIIDYEVFDRRPQDCDLLIPAIEIHQARLARVPRLVAADAGFYSAKNEAAAKAKGVRRISIPNRSTKSPERRREQKKRWFRNGQKWRTGCEGRIRCGQAPARPQSLPLQGICWNAALGRPRCDRRQYDQHRPHTEKTITRIVRSRPRTSTGRRPAGGLFGCEGPRPASSKPRILRRKVASDKGSSPKSRGAPKFQPSASSSDLSRADLQEHAGICDLVCFSPRIVSLFSFISFKRSASVKRRLQLKCNRAPRTIAIP